MRPVRSSRKEFPQEASQRCFKRSTPLSLEEEEEEEEKEKEEEAEKQKKNIKNPFIFGPGSPDGKSGVVHPDRKISKRTIKFVKNPFIFGRPAGRQNAPPIILIKRQAGYPGFQLVLY